MRSPSSFEQPAEAKISATKASSAFALMVTVMSGLRASQVGDVAAVPGRVDHDLVDHDMRRQAGDVADKVADIFRLRHARTFFLGYRDRPLVEDRRRHLAPADDARADGGDAI